MMRMADKEIDRRFRFMVLRPPDAAIGSATVALDLPGISREHVDVLRELIAPNLGPGFVLTINGEAVAYGPGIVEDRHPAPFRDVQRLTEMAVQQHEYMCAELRRMRDEYEQDFVQERNILRTLRGRWLERVLDDQVRGEDALRYLVETIRSAAKPPKSDSEQRQADGQVSSNASDRSQ